MEILSRYYFLLKTDMPPFFLMRYNKKVRNINVTEERKIGDKERG